MEHNQFELFAVAGVVEAVAEAFPVETMDVPAVSAEAKERAVAVQSVEPERYQGYVNSRTWFMALMLANDQDRFKEVVALAGLDGSLDPEKVRTYAEGLMSRGVMEVEDWTEGEVNWAEVAADFGEVLPAGVGNDLLGHVSSAVIDGVVVRLVEQLDRSTYAKVNAILEGLGGKWNRSKKGHVFESDPTPLIENFLLTGRFVDAKKDFGFFPTPDRLADRVIALADLRAGMTVMEPSVGTGQLAKRAAKVVGISNVHCVEIQESLAIDLRNQGFNVVCDDFLNLEPGALVDRLVLNPPFSKQQDIHHVMRAWDWLSPGGRLVAIMSASVTFRSNRLTKEFRAFLSQHGAEIEEVEAGAFASSGTQVRTVIIAVDKGF